MPQSGIHAALGFRTSHYLTYQRRLIPSIIFGAILPDLDYLAVTIGLFFYPIHISENIFHRTFSHSFFIIIIIYLFFAVFAEWTKNKNLKITGEGLAIGMLTHIVLDTFFWFNEIHFLWPLPIKPFNLWQGLDIPTWSTRALDTLEFFCFRWYACFLIDRHIHFPTKSAWIITYLNYWKKIENVLFMCFIILLIWFSNIFTILFIITYTFSIIIALLVTYVSRDAIDGSQL